MFAGGPRRSIKLNKGLASELDDILAGESEDNSNLKDKTVDEILTSTVRMASTEELDQIQLSALIAPDNLKKYLENHNEMVASLQKFEKENKHLSQVVETMKGELDAQLNKSMDIQKMAEAKIKVELMNQQKEFEVEKQSLRIIEEQKDRQIKNLEDEIQHEREISEQLKNTISVDETKRKEKTQSLEQNLDKLHQMFSSVNNQRQMIQVKLQTTEKKLLTKDDRIKKLEQQLEAAREK